ncbi:protein FAM83H isoform X2 [Monodelphis domestica]|uniref:protein FAM83H isoform X2 n=1 Tax=Monodelphis domestica TaxID=13616 RepID=UPI0024E21F20|nr:protein FAM83H isoform X2 [Monodelphis domestica]
MWGRGQVRPESQHLRESLGRKELVGVEESGGGEPDAQIQTLEGHVYVLESSSAQGSRGESGCQSPCSKQSSEICLLPGPIAMARRSQSSSQGDNPLAPDYLPPHYKEYYRLALDALAEGGAEAYQRFLAEEGAPDFLCPEELAHVSRHLQQPQHASRENTTARGSASGSLPQADGDVDMDGSSGTYWPMNSDLAVPELDLGWPMTFGFQGTEVTTLVQPPPPDNPSIKDEARRMIRSAQQVVAIVMDMFTDVDLLSEILEAAARRVPVYILLDEMNAQHFLDMAEKCRVNLHHVDFLRVRTVSGPTYYCRTGKSFKGHVKEKFLLVDCAVVLSGSYSFMWSFEKIHRSIAHVFQGELVSSFDEEFRILFAQSEPLIPAAGALALALTHADTYALTPYGGPGPLMGGPMGGPGSFFPKRAHLLFPPRDEGLGFPSFLDPDRHFLSAFRRDDLLRHSGGAGDIHGLRMLSRRPGMEMESGHGGDPTTRGFLRAKHLEMEAAHGGDSGNRGFLRAKHLEMEAGNSGDPGSRGFLRAKHLEMDAFKRHNFADGAVENFAASRQVSRQMFVSHGDDFRFQTSHFHRDQLYQQHYQFEPQFTATRPQGLFEKLRAGRPGFGEPEDFGIDGSPHFPELEPGFGPHPEGPGGHLRLDYVPSSASREVRHGSDPEPRGLEPGAPQRPNIGQRFLCQSSPTQKQSLEQRWFPPEAEPEMEPSRKGGAEGRAGLRNWRISSYLSGCHSDGGDEGLPGPMEAESYDEVLGDPTGRFPLPTGDLLPSSFRTGGSFPPKALGGGDGPEREVTEGVTLSKQDSFRSRLNPLIQRSSRLRSSLIFSSSQKEGPGVGPGAGATNEKVQLFQKEQTVSETVGEGGETVRTASSSKVAELLEKYKGPARDRDRDQDRTGGLVTVSSHSKAAVTQAWREETGTGSGGKGGERRSLESCLLDLRDSFANRLHEESERQPGAATLSAAQLLDTLGRGTDRLPSRFLASDGRAALPQGKASPPPERKGSPTPVYPERKGSPVPPVPERKGSPILAYPERKGSPVPPVPERKGSPTTAYPERKGSPVPPIPERKGSPTSTYPERKGSPVPPIPERKGSPTSAYLERKGSPTSAYPERKGSPTSAYPDQRSSPFPPVSEWRDNPIPPVPERKSSLTFSGDTQKIGSAGEEDAGRSEPSPMEFLRKGSHRLKQLLSPKGEKRLEEEGGFSGPQENGQPEGPHRPSRGDSPELGVEDRGSRSRLASATANALYSSNLRDDTKVILEQISAHSQKHRGGAGSGGGTGTGGAAHSSPELYRSPAAALDASRAHEMSDKDKCSAIFRSDSFGGQSRFSRTLPASLEERDTLLRKMESMRKEKRVYSRFEVFCKKEDSGAGEAGAGETGASEADTRDRKVGKFMPKILGTFKTKK